METGTDKIKDTISYIGWVLILSALVFYLYGITIAIVETIHATKENQSVYPSFLSTTIGSIQALLITNLGALLGIAIVKPGSGVARTLRLATARDAQSSPIDIKEKIQLFAMILYILVLIACLITWISKGFTDDSRLVVPVVSESGKMFSAVIISYITAVFARPVKSD